MLSDALHRQHMLCEADIRSSCSHDRGVLQAILPMPKLFWVVVAEFGTTGEARTLLVCGLAHPHEADLCCEKKLSDSGTPRLSTHRYMHKGRKTYQLTKIDQDNAGIRSGQLAQETHEKDPGSPYRNKVSARLNLKVEARERVKN